MATINNNVGKFNSFVKHQLAALAARGKTSDDLLANLFKGYLACTDRIFHWYIEKKLDAYEEGQQVTANKMMQWAKNIYNIISEKEIWQAPTPEEQQILTMRAEVNELKKEKSKSNNKTNRNNHNKQGHRSQQRSNEKP